MIPAINVCVSVSLLNCIQIPAPYFFPFSGVMRQFKINRFLDKPNQKLSMTNSTTEQEQE